jgi:hypothetical protein
MMRERFEEHERRQWAMNESFLVALDVPSIVKVKMNIVSIECECGESEQGGWAGNPWSQREIGVGQTSYFAGCDMELLSA